MLFLSETNRCYFKMTAVHFCICAFLFTWVTTAQAAEGHSVKTDAVPSLSSPTKGNSCPRGQGCSFGSITTTTTTIYSYDFPGSEPAVTEAVKVLNNCTVSVRQNGEKEKREKKTFYVDSNGDGVTDRRVNDPWNYKDEKVSSGFGEKVEKNGVPKPCKGWFC